MYLVITFLSSVVSYNFTPLETSTIKNNENWLDSNQISDSVF